MVAVAVDVAVAVVVVPAALSASEVHLRHADEG